MPALSSKLGDVLNLGAGLDFGLALAPNESGSMYSSVSLCVVCIRCVMYLSCLIHYLSQVVYFCFECAYSKRSMSCCCLIILFIASEENNFMVLRSSSLAVLSSIGISDVAIEG